MSLPPEILAARARIGAPYLTGAGIEIGALDAPTPLPAGASVRYVDFRDNDELHRQYPELPADTFVKVDVVDDGERLERIPDGSLDFLIANHMLEHCENPLGALRAHLSKMKPGGWLYYAIPEARAGFDVDRARTPFEHLVADDADGGESSRYGHYLEWAKAVNAITDDDAAEQNARTNLANRYSIHFHVWDCNGWFDFIARARDYLGGAFEVRHFELTGPELVVVLRRSESLPIPVRPAQWSSALRSPAVAEPASASIGSSRRTQVGAQLRDMLGPFNWSIDRVALDGDSLEVNGWLYLRDGDPSTVVIAVDGEPMDGVEMQAGHRADLSRLLWYTGRGEKAAFRARTRLHGEARTAAMLRVSARWPGGDEAWRDRHDHYVPGPARADSHLPMPDDARIERVAGPIGASHFRFLGCNAFHTLRAAAARAGVDFGNAGDVLDWGVGCGRTERFWQGAARLVGCDIDADNIEWCRANLPGRFETISPEPPTPWPDASFDVIFGISVISHLTDASRHAWYGELERLAKPGGLVLLSQLGDNAIAKSGMDADTLATIDRDGSLFVATEEAIDKLLGNRRIYGTTYQRSAAAAAEACRWFDVLELVPAGMNNHQDLLVLRRSG